MEKIEFHAVYTKKHSILVVDQHGREIDGVPDTLASARDAERRVITKVEVESPHWPGDRPHVEITVRVPLEVEERLPDWMLEHLADHL